MSCSSCRSPAPVAWAVKPVVAPRRKLNETKTTSKITAPSATPPIIAALPSWPMTPVAISPTSGVDR